MFNCRMNRYNGLTGAYENDFSTRDLSVASGNYRTLYAMTPVTVQIADDDDCDNNCGCNCGCNNGCNNGCGNGCGNNCGCGCGCC